MKHSDNDHNQLRLQVFLSHNGVCSRRAAMDIVKQGHVTVNGELIQEPSFKVSPGKDRIAVNNKTVKTKQLVYLILNKPKGYVTTKNDPHATKTIYDLIPKNFHHLLPAGRLDKDTEGLLLLTNDGDAAYKITHPKYNIDKTYYVCVKGTLEHETRLKLQRGIYISNRRTAPAKIFNVNAKRHETQLNITIHEGKKRQIRIMFGKSGHKVIYLRRLQQGPLKLGNLKSGNSRVLTKNEIDQLQNLA